MKRWWQQLPERTALAWLLVLCLGLPLGRSLYIYAASLPSNSVGDSDFGFPFLYEICVLFIAALLLCWRQWRLADFPIALDFRALGWALIILLGFWLLNFVISMTAAAAGFHEPHTIAHRWQVSIATALLFSVLNGVFEELVLVGFFQRMMRQYGWFPCMLISSLLRALGHLYQGPAGALTMFGYGMLNGYVFRRTGNLWPLLLAHIMANATVLLAAAWTAQN